MDLSFEQLSTILRDGGVVAVLVFILYGGMRRWWVWGWLYRERLAELQEWKQIALQGTQLARRALRVVGPGDADEAS